MTHMKRIIALTIFLVVQIDSFSQNEILESACNCLDKLLAAQTEKIDKVEFQLANDECFNSAYKNVISLSSADSADLFIASFFENLKSSCESFIKTHEIADKLTLERSTIRIKNRKSCKQTMKTGEFDDSSGTEKVVMSMRDSIQVMTFGDKGLYTKSKVEWTDECSYKVIFQESTNPFENAVLKKGDEREVTVIDIQKNGDVLLEIGMYGRWFLAKVKKVK